MGERGVEDVDAGSIDVKYVADGFWRGLEAGARGGDYVIEGHVGNVVGAGEGDAVARLSRSMEESVTTRQSSPLILGGGVLDRWMDGCAD